MKIVNRDEFLKLPAGTVFAKYSPSVFGELMIKGASLFHDGTGNDFLYQPIVDAIECEDSDEFIQKCDAAENGESVRFDFDCLGRDGFFDYDELYAVWERVDVEQLIDRLQEALSDADTGLLDRAGVR
jgi:hypothetical protein